MYINIYNINLKTTVKKNICVFCSSSEDLAREYYDVAEEIAQLIVAEGYGIMHGAGIIGLMGALINGARKANGTITGVVPERLNKDFIVGSPYQKLVVTKDMKERKEFLRENSSAFITLPGGFGTIEEVFEVITLKQLKYHSKPIIFLNTLNYYDKLFDFIDEVFEQNFAHDNYRNLYYIAKTPNEVIEYLRNYSFENIYDKYMKC